MNRNNLTPLVIIEGPTASGKSSFAFKLAKILETEIVSADSRQVYRYMDIGTSKPSPKQLSEIPHHLIDIINPDQEYSAGRFVKDADNAISDIINKSHENNQSNFKNECRPTIKIPLVVGGTGFYVQALLEGLFEAPPVDENIRKELDAFEQDRGKLHGILEKIDPEAAAKIHPNDSYRLKRALEVWIATGKGISTHWSEQKAENKKYNPFRILITTDREKLYQKINLRMEQMIEKGLIEEIKSILNKGYKPTDPGLTSVGYKEFIPYILENCSFLDCLEEAKKNTRNYAKRQITWYRRIDFNASVDSGEENASQMAVNIKNYFEK